MALIKTYSMLNESNENNEDKSVYKPTHLIHELCTSMVLLNNHFLDNILDRGLRARYQENTHIFLNDLKHLLTVKNRLYLGKFENNKCVVDPEISKINKLFDDVKFRIDDDWQVLVDARNAARNIIGKMIPDGKLENDMIACIYWLGPNKTEEYQEDIVLELKDGRQFSFYFNKNVTLYKTASYNKFADEMIGDEYEKMYGPSYIGKWNHLVKRWIEIIYTNVNVNFQRHIEKFLDYSKLDLVHYFLYYNIKHSDPRFKNLGEYIRELDDNFLKLSDLLAAIWKNRDVCFADPEKVYNEWMEEKIITLNSKILEHLLTEGLTKNSMQDIEILEDGYMAAKGAVKMKIVKTIVEKLGCKERNIFFLGYGGNVFTMVPTRKFWREGYDHFNVKFKYHVEVNKEIDPEERKNDFQIELIIEMDDKSLINCEVGVGFGRRGEMTDRLSARYKFSMESDFNERIYKKMLIPNQDQMDDQDIDQMDVQDVEGDV